MRCRRLGGDSDSPAEMALIAETFKRSTSENVASTQQWHSLQESSGKGTESTGRSRLDATLSEVRNELPSQKSRRRVQGTKTTRPKRTKRRGVSMRKMIFSKIGWTRSFISGPADPLHNPHMFWCHMCKKNFSVRTKGPVEILRHHRTEKHFRRDQRWRN